MKPKGTHLGSELSAWYINLFEYENSPLENQQCEQYSMFCCICELLSPFWNKISDLFRNSLPKTCPIFCVISELWHKLSRSESAQFPSLSYVWPLLQTQFFSALHSWNSTFSKSKEAEGKTGLEHVFNISQNWQKEEKNNNFLIIFSLNQGEKCNLSTK